MEEEEGHEKSARVRAKIGAQAEAVARPRRTKMTTRSQLVIPSALDLCL